MKYWNSDRVALFGFMTLLVFAAGYLAGVIVGTSMTEQVAAHNHAGHYAPDTGAFVRGSAP